MMLSVTAEFDAHKEFSDFSWLALSLHLWMTRNQARIVLRGPLLLDPSFSQRPQVHYSFEIGTQIALAQP